MNKLSRQFALIEKIKSFVGKGVHPETDNSKIGEDMARKIQQNAYEQSLEKIKDTYTPPYLELAKQLQVDNFQIFAAAAFSLSEIAANSTKYRREIMEILANTAQDENRTQAQVDYAQAILRDLKKLR